jgi:hypothetical protein
MTSASRGPVHDLIVDSAPSARKPRATLQRRGTTPVVPADTAGGSSRSVRAGSVPRRSRTGVGGSPAVTDGSEQPQAIDPSAHTAWMTWRADSDCGPPRSGSDPDAYLTAFASSRAMLRLAAGSSTNRFRFPGDRQDPRRPRHGQARRPRPRPAGGGGLPDPGWSAPGWAPPPG